MASLPTILLALDLVSALFEVGVAGYFLLLWNTTRHPLHLLFALGLFVVGVSFSVVSASEFQLGAPGAIWTNLRLAGQTGGAVVIVAAYASGRRSGHPRIGLAIGYSVVAITILFAALYVAVPPFMSFSVAPTTFAIAHAAMAIAWAAASWLSFPRSAPIADRRRLLVPAAFACFAASKYSWMMEDIVGDDRLIPFIYSWRFLGLALMILAVALPRREGGPHAPA